MNNNSAQPKSNRYSKQTKAYARIEGHTVSRMLWLKILAESTPEVREMLFAQLHLESSVRQIVPEDYDLMDRLPVSHERLQGYIHKAEGLLTGMTPEVHDEVFLPQIAKQLDKHGAS